MDKLLRKINSYTTFPAIRFLENRRGVYKPHRRWYKLLTYLYTVLYNADSTSIVLYTPAAVQYNKIMIIFKK